MTLRSKIALGTVFLFLMLLLIGGLSSYYISVQKNLTEAVLKDNYESLNYCHGMLAAMNREKMAQLTINRPFTQYLTLQEKNVTEKGEAQATAALRQAFTRLPLDSSAVLAMRSNILKILQINMQAIQRKNNAAIRSAQQARLYISTLSGILFLLAFTFVLNFPGLITEPIQQFNEAIQELSRKNYTYRLHIDRVDEFGQLAVAINKMAGKLDEYEHSNVAQLMFEKKRAEAVINSLDDASIGLDQQQNILFANQKALQLLGLQAEQIVGEAAERIIPHNDLLQHILGNPAGAAPFKIVVDNRENYFVLDTHQIQVEEEPGTVYVLKNITNFLEKDLAKTNFLATISHELKTPIAGIKLGLQLLENPKTGNLNPEQTQLLADIQADSDRLLRITSELLNMTQLETGKINLNLQPSDPTELVHTALQALYAQIQEKKLHIQTHFEPTLPKLWADPEKTIWVLINLLSNAIRHSSEGDQLKVQVTLTPARQIQFYIEDHGPGIAAEYQDKIFEKYVKAPGSKSGGTGLGLAISKDFVEAMDGKIGVRSHLGQGAAFYFELPGFQE